MSQTDLSCACGKVRLRLEGPPILSAECCCTSCRKAAVRLQKLPGMSQKIVTEYGATPLVLYRKDRVRLMDGTEELAGFRLSSDSPTRRVVATCCSTPVFLDFELGHWLTLYASLWPTGTRPAPELRTMTHDLDDRSSLPDDIPNPRKHTISFFLRLMSAWVAMGFRSPKITVLRTLDA